MLFVVVISLVSFMQSSSASETFFKDLALKALEQKSQKEAVQYKDWLLEIQQQSQKRVKAEELNLNESKGRCQAFGSCFKKSMEIKGTEEALKASPLLDDHAPLIFVSSSMPLQSLKTLAYQAKQHKAKLVIRGMVPKNGKGSMRETAEFSKKIDYPLDIDPKLFQTYGIQKVPVFLIFQRNRWHQVSGNVDLNYALEKAKEGEKK